MQTQNTIIAIIFFVNPYTVNKILIFLMEVDFRRLNSKLFFSTKKKIKYLKKWKQV